MNDEDKQFLSETLVWIRNILDILPLYETEDIIKLAVDFYYKYRRDCFVYGAYAPVLQHIMIMTWCINKNSMQAAIDQCLTAIDQYIDHELTQRRHAPY